jgi:hypothetical protein
MDKRYIRDLLREGFIFEDFKSQTKNFISQGYSPEIVNSYIEKFKHIKDKKYKDIFSDELNISVPTNKRVDIDAYKDFSELEQLVDFVSSRRPIKTAMSSDNNIEVTGEAIYNKDGIELFYADNPRACIKYKGKVPYSWCVARSDSSNMFYTYRFKPYEPAFYFVKDIEATKKELSVWSMAKNVFSGKFKNKYHFFVIQVPKNLKPEDNDTKQYIVTSANNDGDTQMSWNEILEINPKLAALHNLLIPKPFTDEEREKHSKFKNGISDKEFAKLSYEDKRTYLDIYPTIARPITYGQFKQLPEDLMNLYVSFGIGLGDEEFEIVKNNKNLLKRYKQISERKYDEYMSKDSGYERRQLRMRYTELIILSDDKIKAYLNVLSESDITQFIQINGEDKLELLEKHIDNFYSPENKEIIDLVVSANNGNEDAYNKLVLEMLPDSVDIEFKMDYVYINHPTFNISVDNQDFYNQFSYNSWDNNYLDDYFDGWSEGKEDTYKEHLKSLIYGNEGLNNSLKSVGFNTSDIDKLTEQLEQYNFFDMVSEKLSEAYTKASQDAKNEEWSKIRDKVTQIIDVDDNEITISINAFVMYLRKNEFFTKDESNFEDNLNELLESILYDYEGLPSSYDELYESVTDYNMVVNKNDIESYFEEKLIELIETPDEEDVDVYDDNDANTRKKVIDSLYKTLKGLNQDPFANEIENEIVKIEFDRKKFRMDGKIYAKLTDKENNKTHEGFILISNIPAYFTNRKLFENKIKIINILREKN